MTRLDQFESVFKSADKPVFRYQSISIQKILLITDLEEYPLGQLENMLKKWLEPLHFSSNLSWKSVGGDTCSTLGKLLEVVEFERADIIVTYRNLHSGAWKWPFSLSEHLDILTQVVATPVLVIPRPELVQKTPRLLNNLNSVMAVTDHITGDDRLVNYAACFTEPRGELYLSHVENETLFEKYMDIISKIPSIHTENAREQIHKQLLKEPHDFIVSCQQILTEHRLNIETKEILALGNHIEKYKELLEIHKVDLLVMNTKDKEQMAMHGLAYPLAVELREVAILML